MDRFIASGVRLGLAGMVVSFLVNMVAADPLPDPLAIVCFTAFGLSFLLLLAGTVHALRSRGNAS